jgi:mercuric ion transport protein
MDMVIQIEKSTPSPSNKSRDAAKSVLAASGLVAAFGVASCCALPIALSLLGISAAGLIGIGTLAAEYQQELFYAAAVCLGATALIAWRQRRARLCAPGGACANPILDWSVGVALVLAVALLALTFWIEPPI